MNMLWKKESASDLYVDIFKKVPNVGRGAVVTKTEKNNQVSLDYRKKGNEKFMEQKILEAMDLYNASLRYAEIGTENVSIAYGNRSACFFKLKLYEKCIADIVLAKEGKYPERLMPKLLKRHEECLQLMETMDQPEIVIPQLSFNADEKFPGMVDVLQIEYNQKFGRHIIAKCDIYVGKTILIDEAFVHVMSKMELRCVVCSKNVMNFVPCDNCTSAMFCSNTCGVNYHRKECEIGSGYYNNGMQLIIRSIFVALSIFDSIEELMEFVENALAGEEKEVPKMFSDMKSKYRAFLKLNIVESSDKSEDGLRAIRDLYQTIASRTEIQRIFTTQKRQRFLMHLITHHSRAIRTNSFHSRHPDGNSQYLLFIIQSYFNHSCASNVIFATIGNKTICTTARPIKAGDQLFVSYSDVHATVTKNYRRKYLFDTYGFQCECDKCESLDSRSNRSLVMDPRYKYIVEEVTPDPQSYICDSEKRENLKKICIELLNKFGYRWYNEIEHVSCIFRAIASFEECNMNSMISN